MSKKRTYFGGKNEMARLSKKLAEESAFFIKKGKRRTLAYNKKCTQCVNECKQSYNAEIIKCPFYKWNGK